MSSAEKNTNKKLYSALLIVMLVVFALVYNRRGIGHWCKPEGAMLVQTPGQVRAAHPWNKIHADSCLKIVKDGDLVLRSGTDAISNLFKRVNTRDKTYSHAGIVFIENGYPFVYNCIGTSEDPNAALKRDSLNSFIGPYDNSGYGVYRYQLTRKQLEQFHDVVVRYYKERRSFDPYFDLATDNALYCTEFIYKALIETTGNEKYLNTTHMANFSFVSVDNLFLKKGVKPVCKIVYMQ